MKIELTQRDKKLLTGLAIFVIVVATGYWGIWPQISAAAEYSKKAADAEHRQSVNEMKIAQLLNVQGYNEELESLIAGAKENYYPMMDSSEIGKLVTDLVIDRYKMAVYDLKIGQCTLASLPEYQYSRKAVEGTSAALENAIAAAAPVVDSEGMLLFNDAVDADSKVTGIYKVPVSMRLVGTDEQIIRLLDDLALNEKKLRLADYSVVVEEKEVSYPDGTVGVVSTESLQTSFEIYMCEE